MTNIREHFPYPNNPLNEGQTSLNSPQDSEIIAADAAILNGTEATEPNRRFTAPSGMDNPTTVTPLPVAGESLRANEVGKINYAEIQRRLGESAAVQQVAGPMHIDGRIPGQVPSVDARPHIPAGAKPSRLAEMHRQYGTER